MREENTEIGTDIDLKELASSIDFGALFDEKVDRKQVNFWIKEAYGERFLAIQKKTRYKFGRKLVELIELCVDLAEKANPEKRDDAKSA